jgi:uncharacterized membrane protein HdeD (DUF308 family)
VLALKKECRRETMKGFFKKYLWVFEFLGAAVLLAVGIYATVVPEIFLYIVGIALIIFGLFRIIPLLKTTKDNILKIVYTVEILLGIVAGVLLIMEGSKGAEYNQDLMRYLVGSVFYLRGAIYFYSTVLRKESTDYIKFITHIILITLGVVIITLNFFTPQTLAWIVLVIAALSALFISFSGIKNYKNFRYEQVAKEEIKKVKITTKEKGKEAPSATIKEEYVDPVPLKKDIEEPRDEINA